MKAWRRVFAAFACTIACAAAAQRADCPKRDVPMPARPPQIGAPVPEDGVFNVEEGHVSAMLQVERSAKRGALPAQAAGTASDVSATPLAQWSYEGYLPGPTPSRVTRFFRSPQGALLAFSEWSYAADVGAITMQGLDNRLVHGQPAGLFSMRSPSGCVSTTLS
ncbi:MAG TPA: hypothetical protein VFP36_14485, partial [Usitatibacter sp.]|nr:hypothetical protein [Usitatibacter sp.]